MTKLALEKKIENVIEHVVKATLYVKTNIL